MSYHDTAACWRPDRFAEQRYEGELFCGSNFRMSELTGAVMLAQLGRLDGLLAGMRKNQKRIIDGIAGIKACQGPPCQRSRRRHRHLPDILSRRQKKR